ncbi:unnamed protein product [Microthlaspi erraticum]|uniref:Transposase-associated domain-containing protein n=1 Tax=Microthlaspi erraticum TaxID=1685480 RepID=A0A6D2IF81_9BRAS|nr:unnamed protein product [Microthlaspi erraticum]
MDKSWVWLPRTSLEYEQGATDFVYGSSWRLGDPPNMFCPCLDCRNLCHQPIATILDHLVIRGMDQKYKRNRCWTKHGEKRDLNVGEEQTSEFEAYELFRAAFFDGDDSSIPRSNITEDDCLQNEEDSEFVKKLRDAETPLYNTCRKHTKVSAIMGLYRIKVRSGMSENYFDQLLKLVQEMLPEDNVLPTSTDAMKKFLKTFGFGYENIHACKNDCILYRK